MLGIVFTTTDDASAFLAQSLDERVDALEEGTPIQTDDLLIAVTGRGKINATLATERLLQVHDLDTLLHSGTCTALSDDLSVGTVAGASFVLEGDRVELENPTYPRMPLECPFDLSFKGTLVSQDHVTSAADAPEGDTERSYWERIADMRDSTGYAVAYVAAQHGTPCHVAKVVDTHARADAQDREAPADLNIPEAIAAFLRQVTEETS